MPKVSRKEFLKFLAAGGFAVAIGLAGVGSLTPRGKQARLASAQSNPAWVDGPTTKSHAVHVSLLPDGRVLYVAGSGYAAASKSGPYRAGTWDPVQNDDVELFPRLPVDLFCCGLTCLPSGKVLIAGGTIKYASVVPKGQWWGLKAAYEFNWQTDEFEPVPEMAHGRWYPTMVELSDGKIQVLEGFDELGGHNKLNEIYNPDTKTWTITYDPNASRTYTVGDQTYGGTNMGVNTSLSLYPRMHLMPNGVVAQVGQNGAHSTWEPETGRWRAAGAGVNRSYGTSILLPMQNDANEKGAILICGGSMSAKVSEAVAMNSAEILVPNSSGLGLDSNPAQSMQYARRYCNPVILPTGKVMIFGGTAEGNIPSLAVYNPEIYDPDTDTWTTVEDTHSVPRIYHSGALLLPDGRVWTMGTSYDTAPHGDLPAFDLRTEIYRPPYYFETRPTITNAPLEAHYGSIFTIQTPDAAEISKVSLVKVSATTHHYNTDQRLIWLQFTKNGSSELTVTAPINANLAPPGYYMVHLINSQGVPSESKMFQVKAGTPPTVFYNVAAPGNEYMTLKGGGDTRAGEEALTGSQLINKQLKKWTVYLRKVGTNPSGTITARVRKKTGDQEVAVLSPTLDASNLTTSYMPYEFTLNDPYSIKVNDRILIEYEGTNGVRIDAWGVDKFDTSKTRRVKFSSTTGTYSGTAMNSKDTSGIMSSE